jgi:hypothetical protein
MVVERLFFFTICQIVLLEFTFHKPTNSKITKNNKTFDIILIKSLL